MSITIDYSYAREILRSAISEIKLSNIEEPKGQVLEALEYIELASDLLRYDEHCQELIDQDVEEEFDEEDELPEDNEPEDEPKEVELPEFKDTSEVKSSSKVLKEQEQYPRILPIMRSSF